MIEWPVTDANFDVRTYFFTNLSAEELSTKVSEVAQQLSKILADDKVAELGEVGELSGVRISPAFEFDPKKKQLLVWDDKKKKFSADAELLTGYLHDFADPSLLARYRSVLEFGSPDDFYEQAPLQVTALKIILGLDPKGHYFDGHKAQSAADFLEFLAPFEDFLGDASGDATDEGPVQPEANLGEIVMTAWESVQNSPFKRALFKQEVLTKDEKLKSVFEAVIRGPQLADAVHIQQLKMPPEEFTKIKERILAIIDRVVSDTSDS